MHPLTCLLQGGAAVAAVEEEEGEELNSKEAPPKVLVDVGVDPNAPNVPRAEALTAYQTRLSWNVPKLEESLERAVVG